MATKIWFIFSLALLIYSLCILDEEANYLDFNSNTTQQTNGTFLASFCFPLKSVLELMNEEKQTQIGRSQTVLVPDLLQEAAAALNQKFQVTLDEKYSYFINNFTCFAIKNEDLKAADYFQEIDFKVFFFDPDARPSFYSVSFEHEKNNENFKFLQIGRIEMHWKSSSNWRCEANSSLENGQVYTLFNCLNYCLKKSASKAIYLYERDEAVFVNLSDGQRELEHERTCKNACSKQNCLVFHYESINVTVSHHPETDISRYEMKFRASYSIDGLDYYLQLFGVIVLFLNISIAQTLPALFRLAGAKLQRFFNLRLIQFGATIKLKLKGKFAVSFLIACLMCLLSFLVVQQFWQALKHPHMQTYYFTHPETVEISILLCAPAQLLLQNASIKLSASNETVLLQRNSFEAIEKASRNGLEKILNKIYLDFESETRDLDYRVSKSVLFMNSSHSIDSTGRSVNLLDRCFRIEFNSSETRYEKLMLLTKVVLDLKQSSEAKIYVLMKNDEFLSGFRLFTGQNYIYKQIDRLSKNNPKCTNYREMPDLNCTSQKSCIERCILTNFLERHSSITTRLVEKSAINDQNLTGLYFNSTFDPTIEENCKAAFKKTDCKIEELKEYNKYVFRWPNEYRINLYPIVIHYVEESAYYSKLAFKLLNVVSIIYGLTAKHILNFVLSFRGFRLAHAKFCRHLVFLISLVGFFGQIFQIFDDIINGQNSVSGAYLDSQDLRLPELVFCVDFFNIVDGKLLDQSNQRLTGAYLDELTSSVTIDTLLEKLVYLNEQNEFVNFTMSDGKHKLKDQFDFRTTFYRNWKCLEISIKIVYNQNDVYCLKDPYLLKLYLNNSLLPDYLYFGFMEQGVLGRMTRILSSSRVNRKLNFIALKQTSTEKFRFIKHPMAWLYERLYGLTGIDDRSSYLKRLKNEFKSNYNLTTRLVVLEEQHFDYEIHDELFFQFYSQIQAQIDRDALPNFFGRFSGGETIFFDRWSAMSENRSLTFELPDFEISSQFYYFLTESTNEDNFVSFIQNLLNALSIWFGTCVLDLSVSLDAICRFFVSLHFALERVKSYFANNLL